MDLLTFILLISVLTAFACFIFIRRQHDFRKWGIPQVKELPILGFVGGSLFRRMHVTDLTKELYNLNKDAKYIGMHSFMAPVVVIRDLDLIKTVLVKDFDHFAHHDIGTDLSADQLIVKNLSALNGDEWRKVRHLLSPAFTSSKMKTMFELMTKCAEKFTNSFVEKFEDGKDINIKDTFLKYTNDVIATCAFGIEVDSMKNPENEFYVYGKQVFDIEGWFHMIIHFLKHMIIWLCPRLSKMLNIRLIPKKIADFFVNTIDETIKMRHEKKIRRPDMLQLMIDAQENNSENLKLDIVEITAQAFIFFLAGFETTSTHISLIAHELAANPDVQDKLYAEIKSVLEKCDGDVTYEQVNSMTYMNAVFQETLRKHPQLACLTRNCSKAYELPPTLPGSKPYPIKPKDAIIIPVSGIHLDPNYFTDPEKFDPDRFVDQKTIISDVINLGFGLGPRMCIGNRFAILETKLLFFHLLQKCKLEPCSKTCIPIKYSNKKFGPAPEGGFWLMMTKR